MEPIVSGPSHEKIIRHVLVTFLVAAFAAAFLLDGYWGYATNNARQLVKSLGMRTDRLPTPQPDLTAEKGHRLERELTTGDSLLAAERLLGPPAIVQDNHRYYLGPGGHLRIDTRGGRVARVTWVDGIHTETDIALQRLIGWILAGLALLLGGATNARAGLNRCRSMLSRRETH